MPTRAAAGRLPPMIAPPSRGAPAGSRTLLYGRNVDRTAKARARVGLAILAFAAVYRVIAVRLVMFAVVPESHFVRRGASQGRGRDRAARHPRPQRHDPRDRRARAVAVRRAAQDHRRRRGDRAADRGAARSRRRPRCATGSARATRLRLAQARDHAEAAAGNPQARPAGRRLPRREQARLSEQRRGVPPDRPRQHRQPGHRRHREMARRPRLAGAASGGPRHRPAAEAGRARGRSARAACAARRADLRRRQIQGEGRRRPRRRCRDRRDHLDGVAAGLRSQQPEAGQRSDCASTA